MPTMQESKYYSNYAILQHYCERLKTADPAENVVDNFWFNLLRLYFSPELGYGVERDGRSLPSHTPTPTNWMLRFMKNDIPEVVFLMETWREEGEMQSLKWDTAVEHLTMHLRLIDAENPTEPHTMLYGAVAIGKYVKFYQYDPLAKICHDYPGTDRMALEVEGDEPRIHAILLELISKKSS